MKEEVRRRQLKVPAGVDSETHRIMTLAEVLANPSTAARLEELPVEDHIALVRERWKAGEWQDVIYCTEGEIQLDRAIRELEAQSELGERLLRDGLRAIEMAREDAAKEGSS